MDNKHYDLSDYPTDQQTLGGRVEPVVSLPCSLTCYDCGSVMSFGFDDTHTTCDIINGQYTESDAINCTKCGLENLI